MSLVTSTELVPAQPDVRPEEKPRRGRFHPLFWPGLLFSIASTSITIGILWDISWHISIGRDTFWTPAHMAIYLGGAMAGFVGGWLAFWNTFFASEAKRATCVNVLGARAPLGAWVTIWGALAMLTSAPFDDWWHNAYGLDVKIISPPHVVLGLGMFGISVGALLLALAHQNRALDRAGDALFIYMGGIFVTLGAVFVMEFTAPNRQHAATFYQVCALTFAFRLVALGVAGRITWPATRAAAVYLAFGCLATWILPLFPAQPKLAPIYTPITHMVPPAFPLLLIVPAFGIDLFVKKSPPIAGVWRHILSAIALGAIFFVTFLAAQWFFSIFLLTPQADNWFFAGNRYWGYNSRPGIWANKFWELERGAPGANPITLGSFLWTWVIASMGSWVGVIWGNWMKKVQR